MVTQGASVGYFSGLNKAMEKIVKLLLSSTYLCKYLYYNEKNPLSQPDLNSEQIDSLLTTKIFNVPALPFDDEKSSFIIIGFDTFNINATNPRFIDQSFSINTYCHRDLWRMENGKLRPFEILEEIHQLLEDSRLFGIGRVKFISGSLDVLTSEMMGYVTKYRNVDFDGNR